jgi:hypothetical protein
MGNGGKTSTPWKTMMGANAIQHTQTEGQTGEVLLRYFPVLKMMHKYCNPTYIGIQ